MEDRKLTICYITSMHDWNDDRIFERAASGLASLGHKVYFVAPADKDFEAEGVQILAIPKRDRKGKHLYGPREAFNRMKEVKADVYHFHNPNMMPLMKGWAKKGHKVFIDIHENYEARVDALPLPEFLRKILVRQYRKRENRLCSHYAGITVVTQTMRDKLASSGTPVLVVDNVPYLKKLSHVKLAEEKWEQPTIITSGTHSEARNCMKAVEALPAIVKAVPNVKMLFVGRFQPPGYENELVKRATELGVAESLEIEGMLPWLENFTRISKAHVGCVFYNDNLNNRVTLPNRLYEYMYCGLAVLGEDFPEVRRVLNETGCGYTVNSLNPESIAKSAIKLLKDKGTLHEMSNRAKQAVHNQYNFENALKSLNEFYLSALN